MNSEDVDKLFKDRLGKLSPRPSADLWNRLQDRIDEELPAKEEKKPVLMWARSYSVAAAITILLSAGVIFFNVQQDIQKPTVTVAQVDHQQENKEDAYKADTDSNLINNSIAAATQESDGIKNREAIAHANLKKDEQAINIKIQKSDKKSEKMKPVIDQKRKPIIASSPNPVQPEPEQKLVQSIISETPVSLASSKANLNAAPVEIIIKRTVATQSVEPAMVDKEAETDFQRTKALAKNIFKQVKNLSNGEHVDLSEVGINTNKIALETQIGRQKISKVINL